MRQIKDDDDDDDDLKPQAGDKSIQMGGGGVGGEGGRCTNRATVTTLCFYIKRSLLLFLV